MTAQVVVASAAVGLLAGAAANGAAGALLAMVDPRHRLLPNRVVLPAAGSTAGLLAFAAAVDGTWDHLLPLGWLGWVAVLLGAAAGVVVQAAVALLLATRRIGLRSELPSRLTGPVLVTDGRREPVRFTRGTCRRPLMG